MNCDSYNGDCDYYGANCRCTFYKVSHSSEQNSFKGSPGARTTSPAIHRLCSLNQFMEVYIPNSKAWSCSRVTYNIFDEKLFHTIEISEAEARKLIMMEELIK